MLRPPRRARALRAAARARWRDAACGEAKQIAGTAAAQRPCAHGARGASQSQKHTPSEHPAPSSRQKYVGRHGSAPQTGPPALKPAQGRQDPRPRMGIPTPVPAYCGNEEDILMLANSDAVRRLRRAVLGEKRGGSGRTQALRARAGAVSRALVSQRPDPVPATVRRLKITLRRLPRPASPVSGDGDGAQTSAQELSETALTVSGDGDGAQTSAQELSETALLRLKTRLQVV